MKKNCFFTSVFSVILLYLVTFTVSAAKAQTPLPAFPGAMGFGSQTIGGRGGQIIKVTNTQNDGPGSLRYALESVNGPRIIVFDVSGIIDLTDNILIHNPYVTIAGQTAPGDGITLRSATIDVETHDVIVRGLKFRVGDLPAGRDPIARDGFSVSAPWGSSGNTTYNVIIDHNEMAWGVDENLQVWGSEVVGNTDGVKNVTFSWNYIYEGLTNSINPNGAQGMAMLIGDHNSNITFHHNLLAHHNDRNPRIDNILNAEFVNNIVYNWGGTPSRIDHDSTANWINNYYKPGPNSSDRDIKFDDTLNYSIAKIYVEGNYADAATNRVLSSTAIRNPLDDTHAAILQQNNGDVLQWYTATPPVFKSTGPVFTPTFTAESATSIYTPILTYGGAPQRDSVTTRIVTDVTNRSGGIIDSPSQVGGWPAVSTYTVKTDTDNDGMPDEWETTYGLNTTQNDSAQDPDADGYTNVEEYINGLITIPGYSSGAPTVGGTPQPTSSPTPAPSSSPTPSPTPISCLYDIDQNHTINLIDYSLLSADFLHTAPNIITARADINADNKVNLIDYSILAAHFLESC